MDIQHPTLRLMHRWIAMTLFSMQDIRVVHNDKMKILNAMIKKIKIAPVKEMFKHWLELLKTFFTSYHVHLLLLILPLVLVRWKIEM
jgi:hypothetical protein